MDSDAEVEMILEPGNDAPRPPSSYGGQRPPSSYGSMRSEESEEELIEEESSSAVLPQTSTQGITGIQLLRSASPETVLTETTQHTKGPGAFYIDTRSGFGLDDVEEEEEGEEEMLADSPEPPPPVEPEEEQVEDDNAQPGRSHHEQDLPYIFKNMQNVLSGLTPGELLEFKRYLCGHQKDFHSLYQQIYDFDVLDLVDKMIEVQGVNNALRTTIEQLKNIDKTAESQELQKKCKRVIIQYKLKCTLIRKHEVLYEGVARAGRQQLLNTIYVEPEISTRGQGAIDPWHEIRQLPPTPPPLPSPETFVKVNNLFRMRKDNGEFVRTVLTTALPGYGLSVIVGKFCLDWANERANKDLQFVIPVSFSSLRALRRYHLPSSQKMSLLAVLYYFYHECEDIPFLEETNCRFLIIMDCYDQYQETLDWKNSPVVSDIRTEAHPDVLIVNLIRGDLLPSARVWVLGRPGAVSDIPAELFDAITEIQGYNDEMKDDFLSRRFLGDERELGIRLVAQTKRLASLRMLCRSPFVCWMAAVLLQQHFSSDGYGDDPPKLTSFYTHVLVVQTNRKLKHYYGMMEGQTKWSDDDRQMLLKMGKMALKMLEKNCSVFDEEDLKEHGLVLREVVVWSGLCTQIHQGASSAKRRYAFIHVTFQEFMAALYVFLMFRLEGRNVLVGRHQSLGIPRIFTSKEAPRCALDLSRSAIDRTLNSPPGQYDMFLRFLCGILWRLNQAELLRGLLFNHHAPHVKGLEEVAKLLEKRIESAPANRTDTLKECLRELTQKEE